MHHAQFDQFTKRCSRRGVSKGLLAGGAAGALALLGRQTGLARDAECEAACAHECKAEPAAHRQACFHACVCHGCHNCPR